MGIALIGRASQLYVRLLEHTRSRFAHCGRRWRFRAAGGCRLWSIRPRLRREFFPEVDAGSFEIYVRGPSGTTIENHRQRVGEVENLHQGKGSATIWKLTISEIGLTADWSRGLYAECWTDGRRGESPT